MAVVKRWVEVASPREIAGAIDIPSPLGTALCMAAAVKKDHEVGKSNSYILRIIEFFIFSADSDAFVVENLFLYSFCKYRY